MISIESKTLNTRNLQNTCMINSDAGRGKIRGCPQPVGIGLTDQPNIGGGGCPPSGFGITD